MYLSFYIMCTSGKYPYLPKGRSMEISRGWGWQKQKLLKKSIDQIAIPEEGEGGGGVGVWAMDIFWNHTIGR